MPLPESDWILQQTQRLLDSFQYWTGRSLLEVSGNEYDRAQQLFEAPFALMSHNTEADPIFNYGNRRALLQLGYTWDGNHSLPPPPKCLEPLIFGSEVGGDMNGYTLAQIQGCPQSQKSRMPSG